jgi:hypothetical protein
VVPGFKGKYLLVIPVGLVKSLRLKLLQDGLAASTLKTRVEDDTTRIRASTAMILPRKSDILMVHNRMAQPYNVCDEG